MSTQQWNPDQYQRDAGFVAALGAPLIDVLAPQPHERILDVGCGDGTLTAQLAAHGCTVVAIDSSAPQITAALARGLDAHVMDAQALAFEAEFDGVFSNAALHWMRNPAAVLAGIARALKPGGRFVGEMGGHGNVASVVAGYTQALSVRGIDVSLHNPWYFPDCEEYSALLRAAGFNVEAIELFARPTPLPGDVGDWLTMMTQTFIAAVPPADADPLVATVREGLIPSALRADGTWTLDYVRLRFRARKVA